ncbi:MAG: hypothetical protein KTR30_01060 [Saprospiraceae bacterium]|nr:hypothetical protein [Saprospiraceae bacterium]
MDYDNIQTLLDKYFEGNSSLAEEKQLKAYFQQKEIDPAFETYRTLFVWQVEEQELSLPSQFENKLLAEIEAQQKVGFVRRFLRHPMSKAAAVLVLLTGMWWAYQTDTATVEPGVTAEIDWEQYQPKTKEEALSVTRNAMVMLSKELNRGTARVAKEVVKVRQLGRVD